MKTKTLIEDENHAEHIAELRDWSAAVAEVKRYAGIAWDQPPNRAPCTSWRTCGRTDHLLESEDREQWRELRRNAVLDVDADGVRWLVDPESL